MDGFDCQLADNLLACVWPWEGNGWAADVIVQSTSLPIWQRAEFESADAAKAAVIAWMDKTCTQFQNVKNAGCQPVDEE